MVWEVRESDIHVLGVGIEPSHGMRKGTVIDVNALSGAISSSVHKAERSSGYEIGRAFVSLAGSHVESINSTGVVGISNQRGVQFNDLARAMDAARAVSLPHGREVLHVIPRNYTLDEQTGLRSPIGMLGFRLEVEAHIITASTANIQNLEKCVEAAGVYVDRFILNPRGGRRDPDRERARGRGDGRGHRRRHDRPRHVHRRRGMAYRRDPHRWAAHQQRHRTRLHLPFELRRRRSSWSTVTPIRRPSARWRRSRSSPSVRPAEQGPARRPGAHHQRARGRDLRDDHEGGQQRYDALLRAGIVLTGGSSLLPGVRQVAAETLNVGPHRTAGAHHRHGRGAQKPAYSTSVGLLKLGLIMDLEDERRHELRKNGTKHSRVDFGGS